VVGWWWLVTPVDGGGGGWLGQPTLTYGVHCVKLSQSPDGAEGSCGTWQASMIESIQDEWRSRPSAA